MSNAIDLSLLPAPTVIAPLSFETIFGQMVTLVQTGVPGVFDGIPAFNGSNEADPAVKVLQVAAYCRMLDRARVNDDAKRILVAYATGADLDHIGANLQVARLPGESDSAYRERIVLAPDGYSVAGPEDAYIFHARSVDVDIIDATAISPAPGEVLVTILTASNDGVASPELIAEVQAALSSKTIRPMTDLVTVQAAEILEYEIVGALKTYSGPDVAVVTAAAEDRAEAYVASVYRLARDATRAGIGAALMAPGAQNLNLTSPAADIVAGPTQAPRCTGITVTHAGFAE